MTKAPHRCRSIDTPERAHPAGPISHPSPLHPFPHKIPHSRHRTDLDKSQEVFRQRLAVVCAGILHPSGQHRPVVNRWQGICLRSQSKDKNVNVSGIP